MTERFLPYTPERDVYQLLQVDPQAGTDEIMEAWRRLARTFHPDRNGSQRATEEMQVVNALRDLLNDPAARAAYDRQRRRWMRTPAAAAGVVQPQTGGPTPTAGARRPESRAARTAVALGAGIRAFAIELLPARCERCRGAISRSDARCWICGFPTSTPRSS